MKQESWQPKRKVETQYFEDVFGILKRVFTTSPEERVRLLNKSEFVGKWAWQAAQRMITGLFYDGARTWRRAAEESTKGGAIYRALQQELAGPVGQRVRALVKENAQLISSLPLELAERATELSEESLVAGKRAGVLTGEDIFARLSRTKANLIARTEVSKASTALTRARSENVGVDWYVWETSKDRRVRQAHRKMQGLLVNFNHPPAPELLIGIRSAGHYNAGDIYYCRCYPAPVIRPELLSWPHRVYWGDRIQYMTLTQFRNIYEVRRAA